MGLYLSSLPNVLDFKPHGLLSFSDCPPLLPSSWFFLSVTREGKSMPGLEELATLL